MLPASSFAFKIFCFVFYVYAIAFKFCVLFFVFCVQSMRGGRVAVLRTQSISSFILAYVGVWRKIRVFAEEKLYLKFFKSPRVFC